jgi:hypothetical protein
MHPNVTPNTVLLMALFGAGSAGVQERRDQRVPSVGTETFKWMQKFAQHKRGVALFDRFYYLRNSYIGFLGRHEEGKYRWNSRLTL